MVLPYYVLCITESYIFHTGRKKILTLNTKKYPINDWLFTGSLQLLVVLQLNSLQVGSYTLLNIRCGSCKRRISERSGSPRSARDALIFRSRPLTGSLRLSTRASLARGLAFARAASSDLV